MADQHRATESEWYCIKSRHSGQLNVAYSTIHELLNRVETLETAAQSAQPSHPAKPDSSLVERVAFAIAGDSDRPINWKPEARAAIREVAAWLREYHGGPTATVYLLEQEVEQ